MVKEQQLFVQDIARLIIYANSIGVNLTFGEAYRPYAMQLLYYYGNNIVDGENGVEVVKTKRRSHTKNSNHLRRLAVDFNFFVHGKLTYDSPLIKKVGVYWESLSRENRWGGHFKSFKDVPHFERNV